MTDSASKKKNSKKSKPKGKAVAKKKNTTRAVTKKVGKTSSGSRKKNTSKSKSGAGKERNFTLDSVLLINNASTIYGQLNALVEAKADIVIDASAVEMADTSILQLLSAFVAKVKSQKSNVRWTDTSSELIRRAEMLDLRERLGF